MTATEFDKMRSGELYHAGDPGLVAKRAQIKRACHEYNTRTGYSEDQGMRTAHLEKIFGSIGKNCVVEPPLRMDYGSNTYIGDNFYSNFDLVVLDWYVISGIS